MITSSKKRTEIIVWILIISFVILTAIFFFLANVFFKETSIEKINSTDLIESNHQEKEKNNTNKIENTEETAENKENNEITNENDNTINHIKNETEKDNNKNNVKNEVEETNEIKNLRKFGSNVAFIGNSRTQAFLMYTGLKDVTDYTNIGLMVDTAITKKFITNQKGEKITILEDLKTKNIDTIYIMLGINELGWVYSNIFIQKYEELINKIKEIKPNCEIIVQSIIPVTKTKSDSDSIYNNNRIKEYNALIKEMANRKGIQYINLGPALVDENGNLPENASPDGIHLNKEYCLKWLECLKNN